MDEGGAGAAGLGVIPVTGAAAVAAGGLPMALAFLMSKSGFGLPMGRAVLMSKSGFAPWLETSTPSPVETGAGAAWGVKVPGAGTFPFAGATGCGI